MEIEDKQKLINQLYKRLYVLNNHEILRKAIEHSRLLGKRHKVYFTSKQIHSGKILLKVSGLRVYPYWYIVHKDGILSIDSGHSIKELKDTFTTYFNQIKK